MCNNYEAIDTYRLVSVCSLISSCLIKYRDASLFVFANEKNDRSQLKSLLDLIVNVTNLTFKPLQLTKVFIIGLINLLNTPVLLEQCEDDYKVILYNVYNLLIIQKQDETEKLKIELQDEVDCGFIDEDEDDDDIDCKKKRHKRTFDDESMFLGYEELADVMKYIENQITGQDEFSLFNYLIALLKEKHDYFLNGKFLGCLTKNEKEKLIDLLKTRRHKVGQREFVRHIVKIKRK